MKTCSALYIIRKFQIQTISLCNYYNKPNSKYKTFQSIKTSILLLKEVHDGRATLKTTLTISDKIKYYFNTTFTSQLLGNYSNMLATYFHGEACSWVLTVDLFIIIKTSKQSACLPVSEQKNTVRNIHLLMVWWRETEPHENTRHPKSCVQKKDTKL